MSIVRLVYYTVVNDYMYKHVRDLKYRRYEIKKKLLEQVHLGQLNIVNSLRIDERQNMSEELLAIVSAPLNDTLSMSGMENISALSSTENIFVANKRKCI